MLLNAGIFYFSLLKFDFYQKKSVDFPLLYLGQHKALVIFFKKNPTLENCDLSYCQKKLEERVSFK